MKQIQESANKHHWPRHAVQSVECRKRDLVIRIADRSRESIRTGEPAFDVEVYIGGVYDWNASQSFTLHTYKTKAIAKLEAIKFSTQQIGKLL
jgi:hypothetical protein